MYPCPSTVPKTDSTWLIDLRRQVIDRSLAKESQPIASDQFLESGRQKLIAEWPSFTHDTLREYGWVWIAPALLGWLEGEPAHRIRPVESGRQKLIAEWPSFTSGTPTPVRLGLDRARSESGSSWLASLAAWIALTGVATLWFSLVTPPLLNSDRYFSVIYALLAVCLAVTVGWAAHAARQLADTYAPERLKIAALAVSLILLVAAGLRVHQQLTGPARINVVRLRENAEEQAEIGLGIVRHMEPGGVYFTNWTSSWYTRYARHVLGVESWPEYCNG